MAKYLGPTRVIDEGEDYAAVHLKWCQERGSWRHGQPIPTKPLRRPGRPKLPDDQKKVKPAGRTTLIDQGKVRVSLLLSFDVLARVHRVKGMLTLDDTVEQLLDIALEQYNKGA